MRSDRPGWQISMPVRCRSREDGDDESNRGDGGDDCQCSSARSDAASLATITEYPIPNGTTSLGNGLFGITGGPDGNVYFTDTQDNAIGQVTPSGVITELPLPASSGGFFKNGLDGIVLGSGGELVFTESTQGGQGPDQITAAGDGTLWWTEETSTASAS